MKKILLISLTLLLILCTSFAVHAAEPVSEDAYALFGGTWVLTGLQSGDEFMSASDLGMNMTMHLNDDGSVLSGAMGEQSTGSWRIEGDILFITDSNGNIAQFTREGNQLFGDADGFTMIFELDAGEAETSPDVDTGDMPPQPEDTGEDVPAQTENDNEVTALRPVTNVKYICSRADISGYEIDPSVLGGEYSITFHADGSAVLILAGAVLADLTWQMETDTPVINFYDAGSLRFVPAENGYELSYAGDILYMELAQ